jgi:DNA-binding transcriptional MerR regulator
MLTPLTLKQVAEKTGITENTLKKFARLGLLDQVERDARRRLVFSEKDLEWLAFLKRLQLTGMPVHQMQYLAVLFQKGDGTIQERILLLEKHRQGVLERLAEMEQHLAYIEAKINYFAIFDELNKSAPNNASAHSKMRGDTAKH